jgi:predicted neutral ceramidase superfamily lipid hydrolase
MVQYSLLAFLLVVILFAEATAEALLVIERQEQRLRGRATNAPFTNFLRTIAQRTEGEMQRIGWMQEAVSFQLTEVSLRTGFQ